MHLSKLKEIWIRLDKDQRLYKQERPIIALTGGISSGKSTTSSILQSMGYKLIDADKLVKKIYSEQDTQNFIQGFSSDYLEHNKINFKKLRADFFSDQKLKAEIENFIYANMERVFCEEASKIKQDFLIYDVALLFEKGLDKLVDLSICVYCPRATQIERLMARDQIDKHLANKIISSQMDIEHKASLAKLVLDNSKDIKHLEGSIQELVQEIFK